MSEGIIQCNLQQYQDLTKNFKRSTSRFLESNLNQLQHVRISFVAAVTSTNKTRQS